MLKFQAATSREYLIEPADCNKHTKSLASFQRDEDGSLIIFSLFLLIMMLMISGMAVDLMRNETHRARLQSTLDRAVLAGASLDQTLNSEAVVLEYFNKAGLGSFISADNISVVESGTAKTLTATASMTSGTYFMNLLGIDRLNAPAAGQAQESPSDVEISLVLDVSGSMRSTSASGDAKINDLIAAANEFVYLMQCDPDAEQPYDDVCAVEANTVSISLIPYAEQVLVGEELIQEFKVTSEHTYSSCAHFEASDFSSSSISLTSTLQRGGNHDRRTNHSGSAGHGSDSRFARDIGYNNDSARTCRTHSYREIVPYSNSYSDLQDSISNLEARGYTSIHLGMKWASALLDPEFQPALTNLTTGGSPLIDSAFDGRPFEFGRARTQKVVVLITDGKNTSLYSLKDDFREGPWVETSRQYIPPFANALVSFTERDLVSHTVTRPRFAPQLCWNNVCANSGGSDASETS